MPSPLCQHRSITLPQTHVDLSPPWQKSIPWTDSIRDGANRTPLTLPFYAPIFRVIIPRDRLFPKSGARVLVSDRPLPPLRLQCKNAVGYSHVPLVLKFTYEYPITEFNYLPEAEEAGRRAVDTHCSWCSVPPSVHLTTSHPLPCQPQRLPSQYCPRDVFILTLQ